MASHFVEISCPPDKLYDEAYKHAKIRKSAGTKSYGHVRLVKRWIDARGRQVRYGLRYELMDKDEIFNNTAPYQKSTSYSPIVHIIGAGPAGYFAALECLIHGLKPIIIERGKGVRERRRDLRAIQQDGIVNSNSNYCFGEGGAGTYSDGKLYTRAKKRGNVSNVIQVLIDHGADANIAIDAHPHIGSNKLPKIIENIRKTIEHYGGEIRFNSRVTDIIEDNGKAVGLIVNEKEKLYVQQVILATGHSARDIYALFNRKNWKIEAKPFALGFRIEHPQVLIDEIQYNQNPRHENLPAAAYQLACEIDGRGVFSFCMCPGGLIVPAATAPGEIVVNGMSLSRRDSPFANSGFVVSIEPRDLSVEKDPLVCLKFQQSLEQKLFEQGDGSQAAPAQRVVDFIAGKPSYNLPATSYIPGIYPCRLDRMLPDIIVERIKLGLNIFNRRLRGKYITDDAIFVGIESRTSAPVKIPRSNRTLEHVDVKRLYPCGEGAGYAGGIMSAALDGQRVVQAVAHRLKEEGLN